MPPTAIIATSISPNPIISPKLFECIDILDLEVSSTLKLALKITLAAVMLVLALLSSLLLK